MVPVASVGAMAGGAGGRGITGAAVVMVGMDFGGS